jgi:hypothetical protein
MATTTSSQVAQTNATGTMRPHVAFFEAVMAAGTWTQTADTGQTASGSFAASTGTLTAAGYQVWKMADALQGTFPVFVKFEFGSGAVANTLGIWITIGTGSNGSGTITGILGQRNGLLGQATSATSYPSYGAATTSSACAFHNYTTATQNNNILWSIERTKDGSGANTSAGVIFAGAYGAPNGILTGFQYLPFSGTIRAMQANPTIAASIAGLGTLVDGANIGALPLLPMGQTGPTEPGLNLLMYFGTDIAAGWLECGFYFMDRLLLCYVV